MNRATMRALIVSCAVVGVTNATTRAQCREWRRDLELSNASAVVALATFDDGTGPSLYAAGPFTTALGAPADGVARWNGSAWTHVGTGIVGGTAFLVFDDGAGPKLHMSGSSLADPTATHVYAWDGTNWSMLGGAFDGQVSCFSAFDDGTGLALYAGGRFQSVGGVTVNHVAKWNGASWSAVGTGMPDDCPGSSNELDAFAVYDDGHGAQLYAGGRFDYRNALGFCSVTTLFRWNGTSWEAMQTPVSGHVFSLLPFDDGTGLALYVGGLVSVHFGLNHDEGAIARWNGSSWSSVGGGLGTVAFQHSVYTLIAFDDGARPALYAGGGSWGLGLATIARWDGWSWSSLGAYTSGVPPVSGTAVASAAFDEDGDGASDLHFAGYSVTTTPAFDPPIANVVTWGGCGESPGSFFCTPGVAGVVNCPCAPPDTVPNPQSAPDHGCANTFNSNGAQLLAIGTTSPDALHLQVPVGQFYAGFGFLVKGNAIQASGMAQGDGVRCVSGQLIRFGGHNAGTNGNPSGTWIYPNTAQTVSVSVATGQSPGETANYQLYYRNAQAGFCGPGTINWSGGRSVIW